MKLFTSVKPNAGRIVEIQGLAMANWRECFPGCDIVDVGNGRRFDSCLEKLGPGDVAAWINADILFCREEVERLRKWLVSARSPFLVIGQRTDLLPGGQRELHRPSGMDYFFFTKEAFEGLPPVIMGRSYCDSALVAHCLRKGVPVIDATKVITALHQWHDYAHVSGGREEVFEGEEAQANKRNNRLKDFGPHIADARWEFKASGEDSTLSVVRKHVPILRRLGLWGLWNRLTRGGIGFWGIHEYLGKNGCRYFTRTDLDWCSPTSTEQMWFKKVAEAPGEIWTGFDFPCMWRGWHEKKRGGHLGLRWVVHLWDPPSLSHRDKCPPLRWAIDFVFRWFARRCDGLVLNIHPGLLDEIGFSQFELDKWKKSGKLELRLQEAFDGLAPEDIPSELICEYDFGVVSYWTEAKGGWLMASALDKMPGKTCLWIGDSSRGSSMVSPRITFAGRLPQDRAFEELKNCRILVAPYLPVRSLKWNYVLKLFEYLQLGRPILASDNPGNVVVAEKYPGRITLFRSGDVNDLVEKASALCASLRTE